MNKKNTLVIIASVVLAAVLVGLFVLERQNPEGGVALLASMMG